jgi:hypothetical protein
MGIALPATRQLPEKWLPAEGSRSSRFSPSPIYLELSKTL